MATSKFDDVEITGGELAITNAPSASAGLSLTGSSWTQLHITSTGATTDPIIKLAASSADWTIYNDQSASNVLDVRNDGGSSQLKLTQSGGLWINGNCSAESFTDRSPVMADGKKALEILEAVKPEAGSVDADGWGEVDHETIGPMLKPGKGKPQDKPQGAPVDDDADDAAGRDIGKNIQINSAAILELYNEIKELKARVAELEKKKK